MFDQSNEPKKLDWMYKGPTSTINREEYLLGRTVDKTLEQLNEEKHGVNQAKNRVEHECIPPSIRDFGKKAQAEQVDLSTKLQEDPLVAIKKREEESRREFLSNPVQLKKLQKALKAQAKKNKKTSKKDDKLDKKLTAKLLSRNKKKRSKEERDLDTILIHKYQDKLSVNDLKNILEGSITGSEDDESSNTQSDSDSEKGNKHKSTKYHSDSDSGSKLKKQFGLVDCKGKKITLEYRREVKKHSEIKKEAKHELSATGKAKHKRLSEKEKDKLRREMMANAAWRDKERETSVRKYKEREERENRDDRKYDKDFVYRQMLQSTSDATVESRIKSNVNNIQRSRNDMERHFSKRH